MLLCDLLADIQDCEDELGTYGTLVSLKGPARSLFRKYLIPIVASLLEIILVLLCNIYKFNHWVA